MTWAFFVLVYFVSVYSFSLIDLQIEDFIFSDQFCKLVGNPFDRQLLLLQRSFVVLNVQFGDRDR
jgi:hypothetical protein